MSLVYIGLGANLDQPQQQLEQAFIELAQLPSSTLVSHSSLYHSKPVGPQDQPDYVNAVALLDTQLAPLELLDALQQLEQDHGRIRKRHWGERTLDLDIILIDNQIIESERLTVPHPFAQQRSFVLIPLSEINPDLSFPDGIALEQLLTGLDNDLIRIRD
ncbi:MAG: 2-amino-4-hydroxy-6-hydroxymethyldihydropteridine diphosphokinase [Oleispira antarctica]|nr:2-amino-4-hydroxy-6-hydroxymethyldihydropteridine diphosphokinase [Oleispira antarctica]MBQ0790931.1 2-amino-4-hydroxy-6-hydroxymethyldihydropteridine diphosphokinase [Oleispira antarctica]|tara:strand:+ start:811 stop:1290 length:480 start_codon:yes stop_codon:yes gene_type:complete